jgi:hypothetical protein
MNEQCAAKHGLKTGLVRWFILAKSTELAEEEVEAVPLKAQSENACVRSSLFDRGINQEPQVLQLAHSSRAGDTEIRGPFSKFGFVKIGFWMTGYTCFSEHLAKQSAAASGRRAQNVRLKI